MLRGTHQPQPAFIHFHLLTMAFFRLFSFLVCRCRSCAKLGHKLDQLAHQYHQHDEPLLKIGTVEYMAGRDICRALNIEALPTIHLYTRDTTTGALEKVQDFTCPPSAFDQLQAYCRHYVDMARQAQQQKQTVPLLGHGMNDDEESFVQALNRGQALMEASLQDTQKAGKLRSGWKRLFAGTSKRLRRVVNGNIDQEAAIALLD
jgi:thioredoxin-like negative regulator of GroEL